MGVYPPQEDSRLLVDVMACHAPLTGARVADLCTGSGFAAIAAARLRAESVAAFDLSPRAVRCARANALAARVEVDVHLGHWTRAAEFRPFDLVIANPPYVPCPGSEAIEEIPDEAGPPLAFDAGPDGRLVLDPLCRHAPDLLADGGRLLLVHSEFADVDATVEGLRDVGLRANVITQQRIPFGPVMTARAEWLERTGRLEPGRRTELIAVLEGVKR
jgi:release factor glutamine methyltransferase